MFRLKNIKKVHVLLRAMITFRNRRQFNCSWTPFMNGQRQPR